MTRRVHQDGIRFMGMRYIDPTLAAYVGAEVLLRYDPRDVAEIRVFHDGRFLCRAVCQELAGSTVPLRDIVSARNRCPSSEGHLDRERSIKSPTRSRILQERRSHRRRSTSDQIPCARIRASHLPVYNGWRSGMTSSVTDAGRPIPFSPPSPES
jgi:hypothetical protein